MNLILLVEFVLDIVVDYGLCSIVFYLVLYILNWGYCKVVLENRVFFKWMYFYVILIWIFGDDG